MKNLCTIRYFPELNQSLVNEKLIDKKFYNSEILIQNFLDCVEEVHPTNSEEGVHIGVSFTNTMANLVYLGRKNMRENFSFMFWPIYGEVEYEFKRGDFFINNSCDPRVLLKGWLFNTTSYEAKLFFTKNPYRNPNDYQAISSFLPDITGDKKFVGRY